MQKQGIVLVGAGGHCKSVIDVIEVEDKFQIVGILDLPQKVGESILGYPIIGTDEDIPNLVKEYRNFHITIGQIESPLLRIKLFDILNNEKAVLPVIISPLAYVSKSSIIREGTVVMHQAIINAEAMIGQNCIINSKALVEHEAIVGNHCHISTNTIINGQVVVGNNSFIGSNTTVYNNVNITDGVVVSGGSIVVKNIEANGTYIGSPLRKIG